MRLIHIPFANIWSRVAITGESLAIAVAYLLIVLMILTVLGETFLTIMRAYR